MVKTSKKDNIPDLVTEDGSRTKSDSEKSNVLNLFFNSVFTKEKLDRIPEFEYQVKEDSFVSESSVTELEMKNYLLNLKTEKSPGTDELHPRYTAGEPAERETPVPKATLTPAPPPMASSPAVPPEPSHAPRKRQQSRSGRQEPWAPSVEPASSSVPPWRSGQSSSSR